MITKTADAAKLHINIDVYFKFDDSQIAASEIRPIRLSDSTIDDQAIADYQAFILQTVMYLEDIGFKVLEEHQSKSSQTSYYYTLVNEESYNKGNYKYIIFLRISDHAVNLNQKEREWVNQFRRNTATKLHAKWKLRNIIVNDSKYEDYDEASEAVEGLARNWVEQIK